MWFPFLLYLCTANFVFGDSVRYTIVSDTVEGLPCISDCINGECYSDKQLTEKKQCFTNGLLAPIYHTAMLLGDEEHCLSRCGKFGRNYEWCYTTEEKHWDVCSSTADYDRTLFNDKCTTECTKYTGHYWCKEKPSSSKSVTCIPRAKPADTKRIRYRRDRILSPHRLVYYERAGFTEDAAYPLEHNSNYNRQTITGAGNNPVTSYTTRTVVVNNKSITLPLVIRAHINSQTVNHDDRKASDISGEVRRNVNNMLLGNMAGYAAGHLIAFQNKGPNEVYNFVPQTNTLNNGRWKIMENFINKWARFGCNVDMLVVVMYPTSAGVNQMVPEKLAVKVTFYNQDGSLHSDCEDMVFYNSN